MRTTACVGDSLLNSPTDWSAAAFARIKGVIVTGLKNGVFSLLLMGANFTDYLREAHRTLKLDGQLHVLEATEQFTDRNAFVKTLEALGFAIVSMEDKWKFTHIRALKTERQSREGVELRF
ncbi:MAG TPA: hypothetical protein VH575_18155 [Gemmataceae bacterium]|jgi:hypothetical protein